MRTVILLASLCGLILGGTACRVVSDSSRATQIQELGSSVDDCLSRNRGRPVLIAFVAKWDTTGVFPRWALETDQARAAIRQHEVVPIVADVTERMDVLTGLQRFGRAGPPLVVLFNRDHTREFVLANDTNFVTSKNGVTITNGEIIAQFIRDYL